MANEYSNAWRIEVGDGQETPGFAKVGGEVSFEWSRSSKEIDTSSKDDGSYATMGYGRQSVSIRANGKLKLPDVGIERISVIAKSPTPELMVRITKGEIVKYEGLVAVGNFSLSFPDDDVATYSYEMKSAAAPTVDNLGATS